MSLKSIDIDAAIRRIADQRVEDAIAAGKFSNLPGRGQPVELEPIPTDEKARATWWALRIFRRNDITPDEVVWRKAIDRLTDRLAVCTDPAIARTLVAEINALAGRVNTLGTNAIDLPVVPLDLATVLDAVRRRSLPPQ